MATASQKIGIPFTVFVMLGAGVTGLVFALREGYRGRFQGGRRLRVGQKLCLPSGTFRVVQGPAGRGSFTFKQISSKKCR